jgi:hypothetical protein
MGTGTLVDEQIDGGWKLVRGLARNEFDVTAACWVKTREEGRWFLYIASKEVEEKGPAAAYREAYKVLQTSETPWISMSEIKLIDGDNPIAKDIFGVQQRDQGGRPIHSHRDRIGPVPIEEIYIYPNVKSCYAVTSLGQAVPEFLTSLGQPVGPEEYIEIPYLKPAQELHEKESPMPAILRLKKKKVRVMDVLTDQQIIEGRRFSTYAKISLVDDGVIGVEYRVEEIK